MPPIVKISKEDAEKRLRNVPQEYSFYCHDGRVFLNLADLGTALANMAEDIFSYHANKEKNDFSNWVRDVIGDETLSRQLRQAKTPAQAKRVVEQRVAFLASKV